MTTVDRDAELRAAFASLSDDAVVADACPSTEHIWDGANGQLPPHETAVLVDHLATCGACAEAWRLARELSPPDARPATGASRLWYWGAAALAVAAALLVFVTTRATETATPIINRGDEDAAIVSVIVDGTALPRDPFTLRWRAKQRPLGYRLEVFTAAMKIVYTAESVEQPQHTVPVQALAQVKAGSQLFWRVVARMPDGSRVASHTFMVTLK